MDTEAAASPQVLAASQALKLQELTARKQEVLSELHGYQVHRIPGTVLAIRKRGRSPAQILLKPESHTKCSLQTVCRASE